MGKVQFHGFEGGLLGEDLFDIWFEARVCLQQLLAEASLHGGLDLGAVARWDSVLLLVDWGCTCIFGPIYGSQRTGGCNCLWFVPW